MRAQFALCCSLLVVACAQASTVSSPLLLWTNAWTGKHQVSYQVVPDVVAHTGALLAHEAEDVADVTIVFLGGQLDAADMRQGSSSAVKQLDSIVRSARSSVVYPYASSQASVTYDRLAASLQARKLAPEVFGCGGDDMDMDAILQARPKMVLVCSRVPDADDGTNAGLNAEIQQVQAAQEALTKSGLTYTFLYVSAPAAAPSQQAQEGGKRRSLLQAAQGFGPYTVCGPMCQTQVRWLEGMLAVLFLALASCAGLVCLYVLDTPTRFDVPKEGTS